MTIPCRDHQARRSSPVSGMTVEELRTRLRHLPRGAEVLAFEPGCEEYCERELDDLEWLGHRVYLHLGVRRDDRPGPDSERNQA